MRPEGSVPEISRRRFIEGVGVAGLAGVELALGSPAVRAAANRRSEAIPLAARPLPLSDVRLTGGPLKAAQDLDSTYLLALEPDRMMAAFRKRAGLPSKAESYGGWDGAGRNLTGHIAGHYLSAVSLMYSATGDPRFKERADYLVSEMTLVQDKDGYLGALMDKGDIDGKTRFAELAASSIRSGGFDLNGLWSPWYVEHKIFAGLRDAYRLTGNRAALNVSVKFAAWADGILAPLDAAQTQKMLRTEFGGMNEVLADLSADTGDTRWWALSDRFEHHDVLDPLVHHDDHLGGLHANTQIPKLLGSQARYLYRGDPADGAAASYFWDAVVAHHSFATGGHGKDEYFGPPDELANRLDGRTNESCNVYNMLKLTRSLFCLHPDVKYAEFQERALFNHVLGSIDPATGQTCYMVPVGQGVRREYQRMFEDFTCCVGSGMENHALHGFGIYYEADNRLWVNLYAPSTAEWRSAGARLTIETNFPEGGSATLKISLKAPAKWTLALRRPSWAGNGFAVAVNGKPIADLAEPGSYAEITRIWNDGDTVTLTLPKTLHTESLPDSPNRKAILWGPLVLAGDLGAERHADLPVSVPALVAAERPVSDWLKASPAGPPVSFRSDGVGRATDGTPGVQDVDFVPFYRLHKRTYAAYWDIYSSEEWQEKAAVIAADQDKKRKLEAATVSFAQPGQMQTERDFNEQGEDSTPDRILGRAGRRGRNWFSFDLTVDPASPMALVITCCTEEAGHRTFDILVDGQKVGEQSIERRRPGSPPAHFFDTEYAVPAPVAAGKKKVTVRFQATGGNETAGVFGIRMIRADAPR